MGGRTPISLLTCLFALGLAGCGSGNGTIPEGQASDLLDLLATLQTDVTEGQCEQVPGTAEEIADRVAKLPAEVDADVRAELEQATANLDQLANEPGECEEVPTGATDEGAVETSTETAAEEPTSTSTSTEEETTTEETSTQEETTSTETSETPSGTPGQSDGDLTPPTGEQGAPGGGEGGGLGGDLTPPSGGVGAGGGGGAK